MIQETIDRARHYFRFSSKFKGKRMSEEEAFIEGVTYMIKDKGITSLEWSTAECIKTFLHEKSSTILVRCRREDGERWYYDYSIKKIKELEGLTLDIFLVGGYQWVMLEKGWFAMFQPVIYDGAVVFNKKK